jgi:predicted nucleic acid binding AN1-type Zn finger protein
MSLLLSTFPHVRFMELSVRCGNTLQISGVTDTCINSLDIAKLMRGKVKSKTSFKASKLWWICVLYKKNCVKSLCGKHERKLHFVVAAMLEVDVPMTCVLNLHSPYKPIEIVNTIRFFLKKFLTDLVLT